MKPKFTVVIITYNRAHLLERAIKSLANQTEKNWEAWIIDDGSTDETRILVEKWINLKWPIYYHFQKNQGEAAARNKGISLSKGEFITFLDSDDEFAPHHLQKRKEILKQYPQTELLHGGVKIIGNEYVPNRFKPNELIHLSECVVGATFVMKAEKFKELGGYRPMRIGTDADLFDRAMAAGYFIHKTDEQSYIYYRNVADSMTSNYQQEMQSKQPDKS